MQNLNHIVLAGGLTRDPELRSLPSVMSVCSARLGYSTRRKDNSTGEWTDKPNYIDLVIWGRQGETFAQYLEKGRSVAVQGRLEWREWEKDGVKRQSYEIVVDHFEFMDSGKDGGGGRQFDEGQAPPSDSGGFQARSDVPASADDFAPAASSSSAADDDIPF